MFDPESTSAADHIFDDDTVHPGHKKKKQLNKGTRRSAEEYLHQFTRRQLHIAFLTNHYRQENEQQRVPCGTCQTLVKPALMQQHRDAYHSPQ
jgi:hypothetical protein